MSALSSGVYLVLRQFTTTALVEALGTVEFVRLRPTCSSLRVMVMILIKQDILLGNTLDLGRQPLPNLAEGLSLIGKPML